MPCTWFDPMELTLGVPRPLSTGLSLFSRRRGSVVTRGETERAVAAARVRPPWARHIPASAVAMVTSGALPQRPRARRGGGSGGRRQGEAAMLQRSRAGRQSGHAHRSLRGGDDA